MFRMTEKETEINVFDHRLVPKHRILSDEEKEKLLKEYGVKTKQLPRIVSNDPVVKALGAKANDVIYNYI